MNKLRIATIFACFGLVFGPLGTQETYAGAAGNSSAQHPSNTTPNSAAEGSGKNASTCTSRKDPIANGLWAGVNLNTKLLNPHARTTTCREARPATTQTHPRKERSTRKGPKTTVSAQARGNIYAGLGDSIAAGQGLGPNTACDRSSLAYPNIVAGSKNLRLIHAACSGATVGDLYTQQHISGINPRPQLDTAFAQGAPALITITAGANDIRWFDFLLKCYRSTCGTEGDELTMDGLQSLLRGKLQFALTDIEHRSNGSPPPVVITGYYSPTRTHCKGIQSQITSHELQWINRHVRELNQILRNTGSQFAFVKFAPVTFSGHDFCSADPWIQGLSDNAPLHPTQEGQEAIARSVLGAL